MCKHFSLTLHDVQQLWLSFAEYQALCPVDCRLKQTMSLKNMAVVM